MLSVSYMPREMDAGGHASAGADPSVLRLDNDKVLQQECQAFLTSTQYKMVVAAAVPGDGRCWRRSCQGACLYTGLWLGAQPQALHNVLSYCPPCCEVRSQCRSRHQAKFGAPDTLLQNPAARGAVCADVLTALCLAQESMSEGHTRNVVADDVTTVRSHLPGPPSFVMHTYFEPSGSK